MAPEAIIEARAVEKSYPQPAGGKVEVIVGIDLAIHPGAIVALLGPSGSGKSTLLRILSGLAPPSSGEVLWHGKPLDGQIPNVAIVLQSFALFPWLTVHQNVEAPLEARGMHAMERHKRALRMLDTVGLDGFENAYPKELSGGMKQRVGFARALVVEPEVLFMDEPFSSLDVLTAENLRGELLELWLNRKMPASAIFIVTHNIEEAVLLADRIIVLGHNPGHIRTDFPVDLPHPRDRKARRFTTYVDYIYGVMTQPREETPPLRLPKRARKERYQMLPHAFPGSIGGFLEVLAGIGGRDDLYHLAAELNMEVDELLPTVEAAALLGFAVLREGDVEITPEGKSFAEADILTRKTLFREAALKHVALLRHIDSSLRAKPDHTLEKKLLQQMLSEHFTEGEVWRQLDTALDWGRYGEIFDYDAGTGRLMLPDVGTEAGG
jgi:NitT/TauT family transport system ATP-binding protein